MVVKYNQQSKYGMGDIEEESGDEFKRRIRDIYADYPVSG